ncbi:MAG: hypothetical protein QW594_03545 [Candidatus Woesearchaeota archaeon]
MEDVSTGNSNIRKNYGSWITNELSTLLEDIAFAKPLNGQVTNAQENIQIALRVLKANIHEKDYNALHTAVNDFFSTLTKYTNVHQQYCCPTYFQDPLFETYVRINDKIKQIKEPTYKFSYDTITSYQQKN